MDGSSRAPSPAETGDEFALWDAAYVLGSLSEADRRAFETHLQGCPSCRQSVGELSGMPALLGQLSADEVSDIGDPDLVAPPDRVLTSLLATVHRRRRTARLVTWTTAVAAAAAVVLAVTVFVQVRSASPSSAPPRVEASAQPMTPVAPTELTARVAMTSRNWGTQIDMNCDYPAESTADTDANEPPDRLAMQVVGRDGKQDRLSTWTAVKGVDATLVGNTSMPIGQIASVQIVAADTGNVLLQSAA
jgi:hypothetical protein